MRKIFLTSHLQNYRGGDRRKLRGTPLYDGNGIVGQIRSLLPGRRTCVFASASAISYALNDEQANVAFDAFHLSGMTFDQYLVLDARTLRRADEVRDADLVLLAGGDPREEMDFYDEVGLHSLLDTGRSVIVGVSAGSINAAVSVFNSPERIRTPEYAIRYRGLGLTDLNIEPHFKHDAKLQDEDRKHQRETLLEESTRKTIYALSNGSHIFDDGCHRMLYGEGYQVSDGTIIPLCSDGRSVLL